MKYPGESPGNGTNTGSFHAAIEETADDVQRFRPEIDASRAVEENLRKSHDEAMRLVDRKIAELQEYKKALNDDHQARWAEVRPVSTEIYQRKRAADQSAQEDEQHSGERQRQERLTEQWFDDIGNLHHRTVSWPGLR